MKEKKHEVIIPLRNVEFFEYEHIEEILSIHFPSQNVLKLVDVNNEEFNQFKEAMINKASLFTFGSEHIDFSDVKPLDVKDDSKDSKDEEK